MASITVQGLTELVEYFDRLPDISARAAAFAINDVSSRTGLTLLRRGIYEEINYPRSYLNRERLDLAKRATPTKLEAVIKGRDRPTSLARFAQGRNTRRRGAGVAVSVKRGQNRTLPGAWLVELNNGNIGLAVRLKPGEQLRSKNTPSRVTLAPDVYLLYGPSVDQVLLGVAAEKGPEIAGMLSNQFLRQVARLSDV